MKIWYKKSLFIQCCLFILLLIGTGCTNSNQEPPEVTFDIPSLIGKNIDQVRKVLGKSDDTSPDPSDSAVHSYTNWYNKNGQHLLIHFDPHTRKITRFYIHLDVPYDNLEDVMKVGNLDSIETMNYTIEPGYSFLRSYSGIKVIIR